MAEFKLAGMDIYRERVKKLTGSARIRQVSVTMPEESIEKLDWLEKGGRKFTVMNRILTNELSDAFAKGLDMIARGNGEPTEPWELMAEAWKDRIATRLATSGGDVKSRIKKLAPSTVKKKGKRARIGYDTGDLLKTIVEAGVVIK